MDDKIPEFPWKSNLDAVDIHKRNVIRGVEQGLMKPSALRDPRIFKSEASEAVEVAANKILSRSLDENPRYSEEEAKRQMPTMFHLEMSDVTRVIREEQTFTWESSQKYLATVAWRYKELLVEQKRFQEPR